MRPWSYALDGIVEWRGEDPGDVGLIRVVDNVVETCNGLETVTGPSTVKLVTPVAMGEETVQRRSTLPTMHWPAVNIIRDIADKAGYC